MAARWYYIWRRNFDGWKWVGWFWAAPDRVAALRKRAAPYLYIAEA